MNRYTLAGVIGDLAAGRRVLVVTEHLRESWDLFEQVADALGDTDLGEGLVVRRTNGLERIEAPRTGGWVRFLSRRQSPRGLSADVVFVDGDPSFEQLAELRAVVAASKGGEVIRR